MSKSTDPSGLESVPNGFVVNFNEGAECGEFLCSAGVDCLLDYCINLIRADLWFLLVF